MTGPLLSSIEASATTTRKTCSRQSRTSIMRLNSIRLFSRQRLERPSVLESNTRTTAPVILHSLETKFVEHGVVDPEAIYKMAQAYATIGDNASVLRDLRRSIEKRFFPYPYFCGRPAPRSTPPRPGILETHERSAPAS
jgi:hypothetical protein